MASRKGTRRAGAGGPETHGVALQWGLPVVRGADQRVGKTTLGRGPSGEGATPAGQLAATPPATLLVIDATWRQAQKMLAANPAIAALPRVSIVAVAPSGYAGLRAEPEEGHLATIDAVAEALGALEGDPARFAPMRTAFRRAVELQLECSSDGRRAPRHRPGWKAKG